MLQSKSWSIVIKVTPNLKLVLVVQDGVDENQETFGLRNTVGCSKWSSCAKCSKVQGQAHKVWEVGDDLWSGTRCVGGLS